MDVNEDRISKGLLWLYLLGSCITALSLEPGFLDFDNLPDTNFTCVGKVIGGYYADLETNCQMFHVCTIGQLDEPMDIRFLCLNGTVFDQETRVCERIDEVDCSKSEQFYSLNLELYGNSHAILEETPETEPPLIIKPSSTTTTTTTTEKPKLKTTRTSYYTTVAPPSITTGSHQLISNHHFPVVNSPDIRFNPEEINISLNAGAPPNIRTKQVFPKQSYSDNTNSNNQKVIVATHANYFGNSDAQKRSQTATTQKVDNYKSQNTQKPQDITPADLNYGYTFRQTQEEYHTEHPHYYQTNFRPSYGHFQPRSSFKPTTYRTDYPVTHKSPFVAKNQATVRTHYVHSLKPQVHPYHQQQQQQLAHRTEKPQRLQLPVPLLPNLSSLSFSSPAPFTLHKHVETKRYTKEHQAPRIIISASASVSDATGRRLNYSLGQIGPAHILEQPPSSYDEYKDEDVGLDPFYHDVPKVKSRRKRSAKKINPSDIIRNEQEAVDVLKFLFDWYKSHEQSTHVSTHVTPEIITEINDALAPAAEAVDESYSNSVEVASTPSTSTTTTSTVPPTTKKSRRSRGRGRTSFKQSDLFRGDSKYSIVGDLIEEKPQSNSESEDHFARSETEIASKYTEISKPTQISETLSSTSSYSDNLEKRPTTESTFEISQEESILYAENVENVKNRSRPNQIGVNEEKHTEKKLIDFDVYDYVDDNYEPVVYNEKAKSENAEEESHLKRPIVDETHKNEEASNNTYLEEKAPYESTLTTEDIDNLNEHYTTNLPLSDNPGNEFKVENAGVNLKEVNDLLLVTTTEESKQKEDLKNESITEPVPLISRNLTPPDYIYDYSEPEDYKETLENYPQKNVELKNESTTESVTIISRDLTPPDYVDDNYEPVIYKETLENHPQENEHSSVNGSGSISQTSVIDIAITDNPINKDSTTQADIISKEKKEDLNLNISEPLTEKIEKALRNFTSNSDVDYTLVDITENSREDEDDISEVPIITSTSTSTTVRPSTRNRSRGRNRGRSRFRNPLPAYEKPFSEVPVIDTTQTTPYTRVDFVDNQATSINPPTEQTKIDFQEFTLSNIGLTASTFVPSTETTPTEIPETTYEHISNDVTKSQTVSHYSEPTTVQTEDVSLLTTIKSEPENNSDSATTEHILRTTELKGISSPLEETSTSEILTKTDDLYETTISLQHETTLRAVEETSENIISTLPPTEIPTTSSTRPRKANSRRTRPPRPTNRDYSRRTNTRHRFSTDLITPKPQHRRKPTIEEEIVQKLTEHLNQTNTTSKEVPSTSHPLYKSANPTQPEHTKPLPTTPLNKISNPTKKYKHFIFNCFDKEVDTFYADPRDCRLFHYCTQGFNKNQLLDMKFVCDLSTYFDDEKLICTKVKPARCL